MKKHGSSPGLLEDLGAIAGLYRDVFRLMGKRVQYGPHWEERLQREVLQQHTADSAGDARRPGPRDQTG